MDEEIEVAAFRFACKAREPQSRLKRESGAANGLPDFRQALANVY
jgi:hypothetical protein